MAQSVEPKSSLLKNLLIEPKTTISKSKQKQTIPSILFQPQYHYTYYPPAPWHILLHSSLGKRSHFKSKEYIPQSDIFWMRHQTGDHSF
ncbi:Ovule protein [Caenorhabditis elegans]|uniref:Ovule protein n=1 Tax=Caenorhabditis elegans TaxID=6239 RepID=A0A0K3AU99_CAEEL|nr:Ovule protein [Caenorhabditis elegans]CTQ86375.1 Ovule protein [Caenorhabditis elegans]|eukprot:NP_001300436.1 Uncharacterized protein CELE_T23B3.8 [Caenorhabditis elegans]